MPLSTAAVFEQTTPPYNQPLPDIIDHNAMRLCGFGNDLEAAATTFVPEINDLLTRLRETPTCHAARMSGSGATCFGIFDDIDKASPVASQFKKDGIWAKVTKLHPPDEPTYSVLS